MSGAELQRSEARVEPLLHLEDGLADGGIDWEDLVGLIPLELRAGNLAPGDRGVRPEHWIAREPGPRERHDVRIDADLAAGDQPAVCLAQRLGDVLEGRAWGA